MPRPWGKLHAPMLSHRKFLRMTRAERGDWLTLVLAAINSTKDDDLGTRDDCISILRSFGNARPADTISQFVNLRLLDERIEDGHLLLHDWADHQPDDPTGAKRKAAERAHAKEVKAGSGVTRQSHDGHETVTGQSADGPVNDTGQSSDLSRESRSRDGEESREETRDSPQPPASGGPGLRANGTSPRQKAEAARAVAELQAGAKAWAANQRKLAYHRGAITDDERREMDARNAPLEEIPDWAEHLAAIDAEGAAKERPDWAKTDAPVKAAS